MKAFEYATALSTDSARQLVADHGAYLAGGNDLLGLLKEYLVSANILVNIKSLPGLNQIESGSKNWTIGALVTVGQIEGHAEIKKTFPGLHEAASEVASQQIRNVATVGGNLSQHSRCWYYRHRDTVCLKKGGNRCFAPAGENQFHAIFGNGPSHIVHPSSLAVPAVAYGAKFRLVGPNGERIVDAGEYFTMPTMQNVRGENVLAADELFTHLILPAPGNVKHGHYEVRYKASHDWPIVFATVILAMNGNTIQSARVVMGAVAPIPWRAVAAEKALAGKPIDAATAAAAADAALDGAKPMSRNGYKVQIAKTAVKRAILQAGGIKTA